MASRTRRHGGNGLDAWPGYVDALSTLLMVIIFVLLVFVLAQAFLSVALSGRSKELKQATQQLAELTNALSLERGKATDLGLAVSQLNASLAARTGERDRLSVQLAQLQAADQATTAANTSLQGQVSDAQSQLAAMQRQMAALDKTVTVDKATIQARLSDLAKLAQQTQALTALRDQLEKQAQDAAARAMTEQQRREAVELQYQSEKKLGDSAAAQIALLNQQVDQLKQQLSSVAAALDLSQQQDQAKDVQIANLGQKLNVALASKVEELQQYRSQFFGELRKVLANRPGIQIVGDRFVFQSEVLFPVGSADLTQSGVAQMTALAITIKDLATQIPPDLHWILQVDGFTDPQPVKGGQFASNWELAAARAITVVKVLIADGVPPEHLSAAAFGEYQPIVQGDTPDDYAKDRRIELRLTDG